MEITLEMLDNDYVSALLVAGDFCHLDICNLIKVSAPNFDTCEIITTFEVEQFHKDPDRESEIFRYQSLVDALQKFNEIEEGGFIASNAPLATLYTQEEKEFEDAKSHNL